jgi:hypothetical protein
LHQRTRDSLVRTTTDNSRLAGEIAAAVVGLQFQDRVKQRVEHVLETLQSLENILAGNFRARAGGAEAPGSGSDLLADVQSSYTMEAEREAHRRATAAIGPESPEVGDMEVELF